MISKSAVNINNNYENRKQQTFKGFLSPTMMFLNDKPAIGAVAIDLFSMVIPRTIVDMGRGIDAGAETAFRESTCSFNMATMGLIGLGIASLNPNVQGVKTNKIFADNSNIDAFAKMWHEHINIEQNKNLSTKDLRKSFITSIFTKMEGLNTKDGKPIWNKIQDKNAIKLIENELDKVLDNNDFKLKKENFNNIRDIITSQTKAEGTYRLDLGNKKILNGNLNEFIDNVVALSKAFSQKEIRPLFTKSKEYTENTFVRALKNKKLKTAVSALALTSAIGMSLQPINRMITKKRTGSDGFVGVEGRQADKSNKFKAMKIAAAAAWSAFALSTIGIGKGFFNKLQYKSVVPNLNQFKFVYGLVIASRFLAARDKNELREISIKDFLGYCSWLLLGGFISNITAKSLDKNLLNYDEKTMGKGFWNRLTKSKVKSHKEILSEFGAKTVDENGKNLSVKKALNTVSDNLLPKAKIKIRNKDISQIAGYLFSGIVLGILIPKINIALTKKFTQKQRSKEKTNADKIEQNTFQNNGNSVFNNFQEILR